MIHATAIVDSGAELGRDVDIGPYAVIAGDVRIAEGCRIGPHVTLHAGTEIGEGCDVHAGAVIGDVPQDLGFKPCESGVRIGRGCVLREGVTVHRGTQPESVTEVGEGCYLMGFSHYAHNCRLGRRVIVANGALLAGYVQVGDRAFISGNCLVHQFVRIGKLVMMGGGSAVSKDVPPYSLVGALHLNEVCGLNVVGMRRAGLSAEERRKVKTAMAIVYHSGLNARQAAARLHEENDAGPAAEIAEFISGSERGICGMRRKDRGGDSPAI